MLQHRLVGAGQVRARHISADVDVVGGSPPCHSRHWLTVPRAALCCAAFLRVQGWGTVRFTTKEAASYAIEKFHGSQLDSRTLTVFLDKKA